MPVPITTTTSSVTEPQSNLHEFPPEPPTPLPPITTPVTSLAYPSIPTPINQNMPQSGTFENPITMADRVHMSSSPKCSFPIYTKNQNIFEWKTACLLELAGSSKPAHRSMVVIDMEGNMTLASHLSVTHNQELFRLTKKSLSSKLNTNFITVDVLNRADGLQLWGMLIDEFQPLPKDELELEDMKHKFLELSKFPSELDQAYLDRFQ